MNGTSPLRRIGIVFALGSILTAIPLSGCQSNPGQQRTGRTPQSANSTSLAPNTNTSSVIANTNGWPSTTAGSTQEALPGSSSQNTPTGLAVVKLVRANLREQPNALSSVVEEVRQGDALALVSRSPVGPWYRVRHRETGAEGWIHGNGIVITNAARDVDAGRLRQEEREGASLATKAAPEANEGGTATGRHYRNVDGALVRSPFLAARFRQGRPRAAGTAPTALANIEEGRVPITAAWPNG